MEGSNSILKISTPGRICLFGEHQDYLKLPVIAAAISKRVSVEGYRIDGDLVHIKLPDINDEDRFRIVREIPYIIERDYLRSALNILQREGFTFSRGFRCTVKGEIPINTGTSSSSALIVSWINFLSRISDQNLILSAEKIAELAHKSEVLEFSEPGGMMDHFSTAIGGIIHLSSEPVIMIEKIKPLEGAFILGNSEEPKDTTGILARVKNGVLRITSRLREKYPEFDLRSISPENLIPYDKDLDDDEMNLLKGTVTNRVITEQALKVLNSDNIDHILLGKLLNGHQKVLRNDLKISTPKIDDMINSALDAGALGCKINGSGGGGCMFAYAPFNPEKVLEAVKKIAPDSYIVYVDEGTRSENFIGN